MKLSPGLKMLPLVATLASACVPDRTLELEEQRQSALEVLPEGFQDVRTFTREGLVRLFAESNIKPCERENLKGLNLGVDAGLGDPTLTRETLNEIWSANCVAAIEEDITILNGLVDRQNPPIKDALGEVPTQWTEGLHWLVVGKTEVDFKKGAYWELNGVDPETRSTLDPDLVTLAGIAKDYETMGYAQFYGEREKALAIAETHGWTTDENIQNLE